MDKKNIFLGGFMAAGKTSVGTALGERTGRPFVDTDRIIEQRAGKSVAQIFATSGEAVFRQMERRVVKELSQLQGMIVALGGGVLTDPVLKSVIMDRGTLVVLSVLPETALRRAAKEEGKRPLLDPEKVNDLWKRRIPAYSNGHLVIDTDHMTIEDEVERIMEALELHTSSGDHPMEMFEARAGRNTYPVFIGSGILGSLEEFCRQRAGETLVLADQMTGPLFSDRTGPFRSLGLLPRGEDAKTLTQLQKIFEQLQESGLDRSGCLIALGGGTVGDITGFAAASWMRGINYIQCPTTLLAQVDSSLGGKTGINLPGGKNLVGAFHQPKAVFSDVDCLISLPDHEFRQGLAEVVKYGLGHDLELFSWLEEKAVLILARSKGVLAEMVKRCSGIKLSVVEKDETEKNGERARLNLGHTIGHALEGASDYRDWRHGDSVAVGMMAVCLLSVKMGHMDSPELERVHGLLKTFGFPLIPDMSWERLLPFIRRDKKFISHLPRVVIPRGIGNSVLSCETDLGDLEKAYREVMLYGEKTGLSCG